MQIYLVRHGEAKTEIEDPARPLSDPGRDEVMSVARHVAALGIQPAAIRHSGKLRAQQTAEIFAELLSPARGIRKMDGLAPGDHPHTAQVEIEASREPLMLVGHLPHLSRLASALLCGDPQQELIEFPAGAIVCLARDNEGFPLQWILTPQLARVRGSA
ncbi:MAG: phosphohistidine phosphatase SixA [Candidatus Methylomirabilales bacterium]